MQKACFVTMRLSWIVDVGVIWPFNTVTFHIISKAAVNPNHTILRQASQRHFTSFFNAHSFASDKQLLSLNQQRRMNGHKRCARSVGGGAYIPSNLVPDLDSASDSEVPYQDQDRAICYSICISQRHYSMVGPLYFNFRHYSKSS